MEKIDFSQLLKEYRIRNGMKQKDLAVFLGCRPEQINRWERYRSTPRKKWQTIMRERGVM